MSLDFPGGLYLPQASFLSRLDPRTKLLLFFFYLGAVFSAQGFFDFVFLTGIIFAGVILARLSFRLLYKYLRPVLIFIFFIFCFQALLTPGFPLVSLGFLKITTAGLFQGLLLALRLFLLVVAAALIPLTTPPFMLMEGLAYFLAPFRRLGVPVTELTFMAGISLRFIPTFREEVNRIIRAQVSRGAEWQTGNVFQKAWAFLPLLVPLLVGTFRRADALALALEARGYVPGAKRTSLQELGFHRADFFALTLGAFFAGCVIFFRWFF